MNCHIPTARLAAHGVGVHPALDERQIDQVLREAAVAEPLADHRLVAGEPREVDLEVAARAAREELDVRLDALVLRVGGDVDVPGGGRGRRGPAAGRTARSPRGARPRPAAARAGGPRSRRRGSAGCRGTRSSESVSAAARWAAAAVGAWADRGRGGCPARRGAAAAGGADATTGASGRRGRRDRDWGLPGARHRARASHDRQCRQPPVGEAITSVAGEGALEERHELVVGHERRPAGAGWPCRGR